MLHIRRYNEGIVQPTTMGDHNREILDIINIAKDEGIQYHLEYRALRMPRILAEQELDLYNGMIKTIRIDVTPDTKHVIEDICNRLCNIHDIHIQCINSYDGTAYSSGYSIDKIPAGYEAMTNAHLVIHMLPILSHEAYALDSTYYNVHIAMYKNLCILYSNNLFPVSKNDQNRIVKTEFNSGDLVTGNRASVLGSLYRGRVIGKDIKYEKIKINHIYEYKYTIDIAPFDIYRD